MANNRDIAGTFTAPELCGAIGMTRTTFELLNREGLVPGLVRAGGHGRHARFGFATLSQMVIVRALAHSFDGYVVPARIADAVSQEFRDQGRQWIPFGFEELQRDIKTRLRSTDAIRNEDRELCPYRTIETAWRNGLIDQAQSASGDYVLVIVDGEFVGESNLLGLPILALRQSNNPMKVAPVLRYRTSGKSVILIEKMRSEAEETYFCERLKNAESVVSLNLGLALRRAVVSIVERREAR